MWSVVRAKNLHAHQRKVNMLTRARIAQAKESFIRLSQKAYQVSAKVEQTIHFVHAVEQEIRDRYSACLKGILRPSGASASTREKMNSIVNAGRWHSAQKNTNETISWLGSKSNRFTVCLVSVAHPLCLYLFSCLRYSRFSYQHSQSQQLT